MRPGMGPSCQLKNLVSSEEDGTLSSQDRFNKTTNICEENKINLFNLKDLLLKNDISMHEKIEAITLLRKNSTLPVFKFVVEALISQFKQISEVTIQVEIMNAIGKSKQPELMKCLQKMLVCETKGLSQDVIDEIEEAIAELRVH